MRPSRILKDVMAEGLYLLGIGAVVGNILGFVSVGILSRTGIDLSALAEGSEYFGMSRVIYPTLAARDVVVADLTVLALGMLVSMYPALKASRFKPVEALAQT
jgi:ABC-type lipoprotein release transport system permease subunit